MQGQELATSSSRLCRVFALTQALARRRAKSKSLQSALFFAESVFATDGIEIA